MKDLARIKNNIAIMISKGATDEDLQGYADSEGVTQEEIRNYGQPQLKPLSEEQKAKPSGNYTQGVASEFGKGFVEGAGLGLEEALDSASFGGYGWANRKLGGDLEQRREENQRRAEESGLGGLNTVAKVLTNIGSGGATTGNLAYNLMGKAGLKGMGRLVGAGALEGGAYGLTGSDTVKDALVNVPSSALVGAGTSAVLGGVGEGLKRFFPKLNTIGRKSGLDNALEDSESVKILKRGAKADEGVAEQLVNNQEVVNNSINQDVADAVEKLTGKRVDLEGARQANKQAYKELFEKEGSKKILNPRNVEADINSPEFKAWSEGTKAVDESGKPLRVYHGTNAKFDSFDISKAKSKSGQAKYGDGFYFTPNEKAAERYAYGFTGKGKGVGDNNVQNVYLNIKKPAYSGKEFDPDIHDGVIEGDTYFVVSPDQIKSVYNSGKFAKGSNLFDDMTLAEKIKPETKFQKGVLNNAIAKANMMTNAKAGSLSHTNEVKKALNDMIDGSMVQGANMQMKPTSETTQLMELKSKIDNILRSNSGVKKLDKEMSEILRQQNMYETGYKANPRTRVEFKNDNEKQAYVKGVVDNLLSDVTAEKNLAKAVKRKQNVLKKGMTEESYKELMEKLNKGSAKYENMDNLVTLSRGNLGRYSKATRPLSELGESKTSLLGGVADKVLSAVYGRADAKSAQRILDGLPNAEKSALLDALARINPALAGQYVNTNFIGR